jgi:RNA polymerase sigma-70 factor (ECF subfamily)
MKAPSISDQLLVDLLVNKDRSAFEFLQETYSSALHGDLIDLMADKDIAEQVLKKAFVAAYFTITCCKGRKGKLYTWMLHMTLRMVFETMRVIEEWPTANQLQEASASMCAVLDAMDAPSRKIIHLIYCKGYSKAKVAKRLHVRIDTVEALLQTGLKQLQQSMNNYHWK